MSYLKDIDLQSGRIVNNSQEFLTRCPGCGRMSLYVNLVTGMYICHRATCSLPAGRLTLSQRSRMRAVCTLRHTRNRLDGQAEDVHNKPQTVQKATGTPVDTLLSYPVYESSGRLAMEVRDFYRQLRGYVRRSEVLKPKALTDTPGYCGLHFPYLSAGETSLVLVEDIVSAEILTPYVPAAALLGSYLTNNQVQYLLDCGVRRVVFCLDDDATHKAIKLARTHRALLNASAVMCSPDPKDMSHKQLQELVQRIRGVV